ncbi:hypothetical protein J5N58_21280 [Rhizobium cremeum]|nr:hypothetical protein [Rhizobium cremeum]MCJ7997003.1 hypothetical protein [Rhizobium cremeum]MCJ8002221.1 hypothetical protein [Rhizobium cremeum]
MTKRKYETQTVSRIYFFEQPLRDFFLRRPEIQSNHLAQWTGARAGKTR